MSYGGGYGGSRGGSGGGSYTNGGGYSNGYDSQALGCSGYNTLLFMTLRGSLYTDPSLCTRPCVCCIWLHTYSSFPAAIYISTHAYM